MWNQVKHSEVGPCKEDCRMVQAMSDAASIWTILRSVVHKVYTEFSWLIKATSNKGMWYDIYDAIGTPEYRAQWENTTILMEGCVVLRSARTHASASLHGKAFKMILKSQSMLCWGILQPAHFAVLPSCCQRAASSGSRPERQGCRLACRGQKHACAGW